MLRIAAHSVLFLVVLATGLVTYLVRERKLEDFTILNFRSLFNHNNINQIISSLSSGETLARLSTVDDPGFSILLSLTTFLSGSGLIAPQWMAPDFPALYILAILAFHFLTLIFVFTSKQISDRLKLSVGVFFIFPVTLAVFTGFDVYLFPVYAMSFCLVIVSDTERTKIPHFKIAALSALIGFCELMRSGSGHFLILSLILFFFTSSIGKMVKGKVIAIAFLPYIVIKSVPFIFFQRSGHTFWHAVHAGLFEFGGCVGQKGEAYPFFIFPQEDLRGKSLALCKNGWDDMTQNLVVRLAGVKEVYTPEYDQVLKVQTLDLISNHFLSFVSLIVERLIRIFSFFPYYPFGKPGTINMEFGPLTLVWGITCLTLTGFALYKNKHSRVFQLLAGFLLLSLAPPLLVHSGYVIYNIPVVFVITLIWILAVTEKKKVSA
ncbi:MAG: hypothetical protein V4598_11020 [Bdellovibrionota bacterium]